MHPKLSFNPVKSRTKRGERVLQEFDVRFMQILGLQIVVNGTIRQTFFKKLVRLGAIAPLHGIFLFWWHVER